MGDPRRQLGRDSLEDERKAARLLKPVRVFEDPDGVLSSPTLHLEAAYGVHTLRRQAEMAHHRDLAIHQGTNDVCALGTALQLHGSCSALEKATRIAQGFLNTEVIAQIGHVGDEQGSRPSSVHRFEMMVHHRHADRQRVVEAKTDIADTVADQDHVYDRISQPCRDSIIGRRHDEPPAVTSPLLEHWNCDRRCIRWGEMAHRVALRLSVSISEESLPWGITIGQCAFYECKHD